MVMANRSILFVNPDYHCSFFLRDEFRRLGWRADVLRNSEYPKALLWSDDCLVAPDGGPKRAAYLQQLASTYKYFLCYGDAEVLRVGHTFRFSRLLSVVLGSWELAFLRLHGCKLLFFPSGCRQEVLRADFTNVQGGRVCANCGWADSVCKDVDNAKTFTLVNRFHSFAIENSPIPSSRIRKRPLRYKSLDLDIYSPGAAIPERYQLPLSKSVRILHSFYDANRAHGGKNIKGSPYVVDAINRLEAAGMQVEYIQVRDTPLKEMRFLQLQADIIVDQLIYGWWGSTAIESMALGKPTICFLLPEWKDRFLSQFPEYSSLPIVEATTDSIYDVLKYLVLSPAKRRVAGEEARKFALRHFDVRRNAREIEALLERL